MQSGDNFSVTLGPLALTRIHRSWYFLRVTPSPSFSHDRKKGFRELSRRPPFLGKTIREVPLTHTHTHTHIRSLMGVDRRIKGACS